MRNKSKVLGFMSSQGRKIVKSTQVFVKDVSKGISRMKLQSVYVGAQKSLRSTIKQGRRTFIRSYIKFRRTATYKVLTRRVPKFYGQFSSWSLARMRELKYITTSSYNQSRKWVLKNYPKAQVWVGSASSNAKGWVSFQYPKLRKFMKANYPRIQSFVLNQFPTYRLIFSKMV